MEWNGFRHKLTVGVSTPLYPNLTNEYMVDTEEYWEVLEQATNNSFTLKTYLVRLDGFSKISFRGETRPTSSVRYWYAYRKIAGKTTKVYVGTDLQLNNAKLREVTKKLLSPPIQELGNLEKLGNLEVETEAIAKTPEPEQSQEIIKYQQLVAILKNYQQDCQGKTSPKNPRYDKLLKLMVEISPLLE